MRRKTAGDGNLGIVLLLVAFCVGMWTLSEYTQANWAVTTAKIYKQRVETEHFMGDEDSDSYDRDHLWVIYRYKVDGKKFVQKEHHHHVDRDPMQPKARFHGYIGRKIQIHYDPEKPEHATMKEHGKYLTMGIAGTALLGLFGILSFIKTGRR